MLGQSLAQLELLRLRHHPLGHLFHQLFVFLTREGAVVFVSRAELPERTGLAVAGAVVSQSAAQFMRAEAISQFLFPGHT